ncbi:hypothetical protein ACWDO7_08480 [Streptomyces sp. NPDC003656]
MSWRRPGAIALVLCTPLVVGVGTVAAVTGWGYAQEPYDVPRPTAVPCARALGYGGATLPAGAHGAQCTVVSWQDTEYYARFRVSRAELRKWLKTTYPDAPEPSTQCRPPYDLCLGLGFLEGDGVEADAAEVDARFTKAGDAEVLFSAFAG